MKDTVEVVYAPIWLAEIAIRAISSLFPKSITCNCAKIYTGTYIVGNGMDAGVQVHCYYELRKGNIACKRLRPISIMGSNHDRDITHLNTFVLYPKTDKAEIIIHKGNSHGDSSTHVHLVKHIRNQRSEMFRMKL